MEQKPRRGRRWAVILLALTIVMGGVAAGVIFLVRSEPVPPFTDAIHQPATVPFPMTGTRDPSWSPDGTRLAVIAGDDLFLLGCDSDSRFAEPVGPHRYPAWSPDNDGFAIVVDARELWVARTRVTDSRRVFFDGEVSADVANTAFPIWHMRDPAWSPDGTRIAFVKGDEVWVVTSDGASAEPIFTPELAMNSLQDLSWSPDGSKIVFSGHMLEDGRSSGNSDVLVIDANGSNPRNLTADYTGHDSGPTWSPDGSQIAFVSDRAKDGGTDVFVMGDDGTSVTRLTDIPGWETDPTWSPDGDLIAFETLTGGIAVIALDGRSPEAVLNGLGLSSQNCPFVAVTRPEPPEWYLAAVAELSFPPSRAPEWLDNTFWGSATWSEVSPTGTVVTWADQPFTLSIGSYSPVYDSVDRPLSCTPSPWENPDPSQDLLDFMDRVEQAALGGSFGSLLNAVTDGVHPAFPLVQPASCRLFIPDGMVLSGEDLGFPVERYAFGESDSVVVGENRIDGGGAEGDVCDSTGSSFHIERVGWIGETGGAVLQGEWAEWSDCRRVDEPIDGVWCETVVIGNNRRFVSDDAAEHRAFAASGLRELVDSGLAKSPSEDEIATLCNLATRGTFYAFSLPTDQSALPGGLSGDSINRFLTASSLARSGAATQLGVASEQESAEGFIEVVAEIRKEALTWIVRNMPVYDAQNGTWSSFESYAIGLGHASGVPPDSRLASDPVGTAADLAFGNASTSDMINWLGLDS